ncbi:MAG TPA: O-antigen ligase family protein [Acidothermaceae bacterium]|nr:O-antigen ligase family protein [Acidothermaceae bacterium]
MTQLDAGPRPRSDAIDLEALATAVPLLTLLVIAILRKGAFFRPDIVVSPALTLALALSTPQVRAWCRGHLAAVGAGVLATAWWIGDAELSHHSIDSWRLPSAWMCLAAAYGCARSLPAAGRRVASIGVAAAGVALAIAGLVLVDVRATLWTLPDERSLRFSGPFTYPSAVGLFLVIALIASCEFDAGRGMACARAVMVLGIVATDSRGAVVGLAVALCFREIRRQLTTAVVAAVIGAPLLLLGQRTHASRLEIVAAVVVAVGLAFVPDGVIRRVVGVVAIPAVVVVGWLLVTQHHAVSGFDASWTERGHILRGAVTVFAHHPLLGAGPDPAFAAHTLGGQAGIAYFTHNEPVEILISIGILGTLVLAGCAVIVARSVAKGSPAIPVVASVAAAGLVDFVWHFPAIGLATGIVAGAATVGPWRHRTSPDNQQTLNNQ